MACILAPHEVRDAFEAAFSADRFVNGWDMLESRPPRKPEVYEMHTGTLFEYDPELPVGNLPASPRNDRARDAEGRPVPFGYETACREANRCLTCGAKAYAHYKDDCMTCFFCEQACPTGAIIVNPFKERLPRTIECTREGVN